MAEGLKSIKFELRVTKMPVKPFRLKPITKIALKIFKVVSNFQELPLSLNKYF